MSTAVCLRSPQGPQLQPSRVHSSPKIFADQRHTLFYGSTLAPAPAARPRRHLASVLATAAATPASSSPSVSPRRARLAQQLASVEETLRLLEEQAGQPLPSAQSALPALPAAQPRRRPTRPSLRRASSSSDSSSSSESEAEQPSVSRLARRLQVGAGRGGRRWPGLHDTMFEVVLPSSPAILCAAHTPHTKCSGRTGPLSSFVVQPLTISAHLQAELTARREAAAAAAAAGNIVPGPGAFAGLAAPPPPAAAVAAATTVRVCTGKKCSAGGAGAVLATMGSLPGVHAAAAPKCMGQCRRCVAVKMASGPGPEVLYTGVNASNAAGVVAMHQQQHGQAQQARVLGPSCALPAV